MSNVLFCGVMFGITPEFLSVYDNFERIWFISIFIKLNIKIVYFYSRNLYNIIVKEKWSYEY